MGLRRLLHFEDAVLALFFLVVEPLFRSVLPVTDLNAMTTSNRPAIVAASFFAALLAWSCALWPARLPDGERFRQPELYRIFVFLYGYVVFVIGAEFIGRRGAGPVVAMGGLALAAALVIVRIRFAEKLEKMPRLPFLLRRILFVPFLVFISMMLDALSVLPGLSRATLALRAALLAGVFFWVLLFPLRRFIEAEPFSRRVWLWRFAVFTAVMTVNAAGFTAK